MQKYIDRNIEAFVIENLSVFPAVAILGPRQCGKSTLVKKLYQNSDTYLYLDLQNLDDLNKLRERLYEGRSGLSNWLIRNTGHCRICGGV